MQSTKEKLSNMASAAKEHVDVYKAKIDEKVPLFYFLIFITSILLSLSYA